MAKGHEFKRAPSIFRERDLAFRNTHQFHFYHDIHTLTDFKASCHMLSFPSCKETTFETVKRFILLLFWLSKNHMRCDVFFSNFFPNRVHSQLIQSQTSMWNVFQCLTTLHFLRPSWVSFSRTWSWAVSTTVSHIDNDKGVSPIRRICLPIGHSRWWHFQQGEQDNAPGIAPPRLSLA